MSRREQIAYPAGLPRTFTTTLSLHFHGRSNIRLSTVQVSHPLSALSDSSSSACAAAYGRLSPRIVPICVSDVARFASFYHRNLMTSNASAQVAFDLEDPACGPRT